MHFDLLIAGGRVIDGTGNPGYVGDVGVRGDTIAAVGHLPGATATRRIDADGLVVCPGFIDMHVHSDVMLLADPRHEAKVRQGVTTELLGQDGLSYAPLTPANLRRVRRYLAGLNGDPPIAWDWSSVAEFLDRFDRQVAVNVAYLAPHNALRIEALGWAARTATDAELARMADLADAALADGAFGFSTGLTYAPNCWSDTRELIAIGRAVACRGGIYVTHLRDQGDGVLDPIREALEIGERAGLPVHLSHLKASRLGRSAPVEDVIALLESARARGLDVTFDSYPYLAGSSMLHAVLPLWLSEGGPEALLARLRDPTIRDRLRAEFARQPPRWERLVVAAVRTERHRRLEGRTLAETFGGRDPVDALCDLLLAEELGVAHVALADGEAEVRRLLAHPLQMVGSDALLIGGRPNPRTYGTFPRFLGRYARDLGLLRLEDAVRHVTSFPAQRLGLTDRGLLRPGCKADLVVFDPGALIDRATFEQPRRFPVGIAWVLVNGQPVVTPAGHTGATPGRALRKGAGPRA
jgi:N-acyl-D-amino-acid deacylase